MAAVTLDLSKAQPLPQAPVQLDMSKAQPLPQAEDTRSLWQKAKDNFNANTQGAKPGDGAVKSFVENVGAGGGDVIRSIGHAILHPVDTAIAGQQAQDAKPFMQKVREAATNGILGPAGNMAIDTAKGLASQPGRTIGQVGTGAILGEAAAPVVGAAIKVVPRIPGALSEAKAAFTNTTYPKNLSLTPEEATAQKVVKSLQPDPAAVPNVKSASPEIPDALAYAKREGIPQNGKLDTAKALQGRADEIQAHYDNAILKPNTTVVQTVPEIYDGATVGDNRATLGQINDRVDVINKELKSNFRKKLSSQTVEANASDADLLAEKGQLTEILHDKLGELTGIPPEDIAAIRQRAGKLRSLAQEVTDSANKDTLAAGRREVSAGTFSLRNPIEGLQDKVGGGQEVIGNRSWKATLDSITPAEKPLPQPNAPGPNVATTPAAAQAEFLRAQQLEQGAQDAAAGRSQRVAGYRSAQQSTQQAGTGLEGEAARTVGRGRVMQAWADQGKAKLAAADSSLTPKMIDSIASTPQGQEILARASNLSPNSPMMKSLVRQIKAKLGLTE